MGRHGTRRRTYHEGPIRRPKRHMVYVRRLMGHVGRPIGLPRRRMEPPSCAHSIDLAGNTTCTTNT